MAEAGDQGMESIERCASVAIGIRDSGDFEHVLLGLVRAEEAAVVHVLDDGSPWYGVAGGPDDVTVLRELIGVVGSEGEVDVSTEAASFKPTGESATVEELFAGVLFSLAQPIDCAAAAILVRDVGEDPAWLAARYEAPGRVFFIEAPPDAFNRELVRLGDMSPDPVGGGVHLKPSLKAAEVGSSYEIDLAPEAAEALEAQLEAFEAKFGRPPGPDDPIFFDPTADEPRPMPAEKIADLEALMAEHGMGQEWFLRNQAEREEEGTLRREGRRPIGRNEPCWCGSGKKYKRCHGA